MNTITTAPDLGTVPVEDDTIPTEATEAIEVAQVAKGIEATEPDESDEEAPGEPESDALDGITVVQVDPNAVKIEANVRTKVAVPADFVRSVKRHGVIVPVLGYYDEDGSIVVRDGQRRILAAVEAGRTTVPAYLIPRRDEKRLRIVQQMVANAHREGLTDADEVAAIHELTLEGLTPTMIAKELTLKPAKVKAAVAVAGNEAAKAAVAKYEVTLEQALVLAEFEDDPAAVKALRQYAESGSGQFVHEAQRQRDKRAARQKAEAIVADYTARGLKQIAWPSYDDKETLPFRDLTLADGTALTEDNYVGGNGYRFAVRQSYGGPEVGHFVTDWKKWGLKKRKANGTPNTPWTDEQKAERRELIANNKAWDSAKKVRREWLATFLSRKTAPKNALAFVADTLIRNGGSLTKALSEHHPLAKELLGAGKREYGKPDSLGTLIEQNPTRITTVLLAIAIAAHEAATSKSTWRYSDRDDKAYFTALSGWGYPLSDVEGIVLGITPEVAQEPEDEAEPEQEPVEPEADVTEDDAPEDDEAETAEPDEDADADPEADDDTDEGDLDLADAA